MVSCTADRGVKLMCRCCGVVEEVISHIICYDKALSHIRHSEHALHRGVWFKVVYQFLRKLGKATIKAVIKEGIQGWKDYSINK